MPKTSQDLSTTLRAVGLKATAARLAILQSFPRDCQPINADGIFKQVKVKRIDRVTVYRTLASLEQAKIIKRVDLRKDSAYYELTGEHHHHVVCTNCGLIENFDLCVADKLTPKLLNRRSKFQSIKSHALELFGLCKTCAAE